MTKEEALIAPAMRVFSRFGIRKTTMADIAEEAGVSRQTLYNAYPNKDEVLRAVVRFSTDQSIAQVSDAWSQTDDFEDRLEIFFQTGPLAWFDMLQSSPEAADFIEGADKVTSEEIRHMAARWTKLLEQLTLPYADLLAKRGMTAAELADFIFSTSKGAKNTAQDRDQLVKRLALLKKSVTALITA